MNPTPLKRRAGFSLIEMLVVVAIIAVLLGILIPSLLGGRQTAYRAKCAANLHQTHVGLVGWATSHDWTYPIGQPLEPTDYEDRGQHGAKWINDNDSNNGHYFVWYKPDRYNREYGSYLKHGALVYNDYLDDGRIFYCPTWEHHFANYEDNGGTGGGFWDNMEEIPPAQKWMTTSYHYNCQFGKTTSPTIKDYSQSSVWRPAMTSDPAQSAIMADAFSSPPDRGINNHHKNGYTVVYLGGDTKFIDDPKGLDGVVAQLKNGAKYQDSLTNYANYQSKAWRFFENRLDEDEY